MKLYLEQNITYVDISDIRVPDDIQESGFLTPQEMICFAGEDIDSAYTHNLKYYELDNCEGIFEYLDAFEDMVPKHGKRINWEWGGLRKNNEYFVAVHCFVIDESDIATLNQQIQEAFCFKLTAADRFAFPELSPSDISNRVENDGYEEDDDDAELRMIEECFPHSKWIQWERTYPEMEGGGSWLSWTLQIGSFVLSALALFIPLYSNYKMKQRRTKKRKRIDKLQKQIIRKLSCKGHIQVHASGSRTYTNAKTRKKEYLFRETLNDGSTRKIFISTDGKDIHPLPFKTDD